MLTAATEPDPGVLAIIDTVEIRSIEDTEDINLSATSEMYISESEGKRLG